MYHYIPYQRNHLFIGRERLLAELTACFASAAPSPLTIIALVGMPGVGKTEIAGEYTYRSLQTYQAIVWFHASSRHQLAEQIAEMFSTTGRRFPWKTEEERERIFEAFRRWLWSSQSSFLLVLDQISNFSLLNDVLDEDMQGHVLLTNHRRETTDEWKTITVQPFEEQEGALFLLRRAGLLALAQPHKDASPQVQEEAFALSTEFGGHPLALDQAGAYIRETNSDVAECLTRYRENPRALLERRGAISSAHPLSAYMSIAAMRQGVAYEAQELLSLYVRGVMDCSSPSPRLPPTLPVSAHLRERASTPSALVEMRAALIQNFVLVPREKTRGIWDIHPLVRTVMRVIQADEEEHNRLSRAKDERYEPLDLDGIFHVLISVQQMKKHLVGMAQDNPERTKLARALATTVLRLEQGVLPGPTREQRAQAKALLEARYGEIAYGDSSPLSRASQDEVRRYAQELFALMQYR